MLNSDWGQGFNAKINVSSGVEIKDWTLEFDYARNITDIWDAVVESHDGNYYVLKSKEYNTVTEAKQRITIGFNDVLMLFQAFWK